MRVAYILERMTGGWLSYEIEALAHLGITIEIYPVNPAIYGEFEGVDGYRKRSPAGDLMRAGRIAFAHPIRTPGLFKRLSADAGMKIATAALSTARLVGRQRPAIMHAHFATAPAASAWAASRLSGVPYGFSAHAYDLFKEPVDREFLTQKCADAAFVRCISEYNRDYLIRTTGLPGDTFHVIHCGVDTRRFAPARSRSDPDSPDKTIVVVGNLVEQKGIRYLIEALSDPVLKESGARAAVIGDGPLRQELTALASSLGVPTDFIGAVDNEEIMRHYRKADLFVLPSVTCGDGHRDGIPVVLMEAMACGVPVISTRLSGIPELIEDGASGILVPEKDPAALAGAIRALLDNADLRDQFSAEGRRAVVERFEIRDTARELMRLFEESAERWGNRP